MYWHGTYCIYSMVPIYLFLLYILEVGTDLLLRPL